MSNSGGNLTLRTSPSSPRATPLIRELQCPGSDCGSIGTPGSQGRSSHSPLARTLSNLSASVSNPYAGRPLPSTDSIRSSQLWSPETGAFPAQRLWKDKGVVIMLLRRPGCVLCRYQARELWLGLKNPIERLGLELVCVTHEWLDGEINAFKPYWPGKVYLDKDKELFKFIGGGALAQGSALPLLNPFSKVWGRIFQARKHVRDYNVKGNGWIMGGVLVVRPGGGLTYLHLERELGLPAPHEMVYEAACEAAGAAGMAELLDAELAAAGGFSPVISRAGREHSERKS